MLRAILVVVAVLAAVMTGVAQSALAVVSSVPAPAEVFAHSGWQPGMVGCGTDETITTYLQLRQEIVKFGLNGAVLVRVDTAHLLEAEQTRVEALAPGPNGETYVVAAKAKRYKERGVTFVDGHPTLFRFDANGKVVTSRPLDRAILPRIAVFDSGDFLLFDPGPLDQVPEAVLYSAEGVEIKRIDLSGTALDRRNDKKAKESPDAKLVPSMARSANKVYIATGIGENPPTITIVGDDGKVISSSPLEVPAEFSLLWPRMEGERLFAPLECKANASCRGTQYYAEFDTGSGALVAMHRDTGSVTKIPMCNTSSGMSFLNGAEQTLEVLTPTVARHTGKE